MTINLLNFHRVNFIVIGLFLSFLYALPTLAQPTRPRPIPYQMRMEFTRADIKELEQVSSQIENDKSNVALYKKRLEIYDRLRKDYFDDVDTWRDYDNKYGADLSRIIGLERTAENYLNRGKWFFMKIAFLGPYYPPPNKVSELYPRNIYVDKASADFLKAVQLTSDPKTLSEIYGALSSTYLTRAQALAFAPDFPKWKDEIPLELVRQDLDSAIKYSQLALKVGSKLSDSKAFEDSLRTAYLASAQVAAKSGDSETSLKFTQAAQKYR